MDLSVGAYNKIELSSGYNNAVMNEPLHFGVSQSQNSFSKIARSDIPEVKDNLTKSGVNFKKPFEPGERNITDYLNIENIENFGINSSINSLSFMLQVDANGDRSLFDVAKLYEEESERVKGLTNITNKERELRLQALDSAFVETARFLYSTTTGADIGRNFDTLTGFVENAIQNLQVGGLSKKTQSLMVQAMDRTVTFYKTLILHEARDKMINQRMMQKGRRLSRKEIIDIDAQNNKNYKKQLDKIRDMLNNPFNQLKWTPTVNSDEKGQNEDGLLNIADEENIDQENINEENTVEEASSEDIPSENSSEA